MIMISLGLPYLRLSTGLCGKLLISINYLSTSARQDLLLFSCTKRFCSYLQATGNMELKPPATMQGAESLQFQGKMDRFKGITVETKREPCDVDTFVKKLNASLVMWEEQKVRGVWFKVAIEHAELVPILAKHEFWFHHARPEAVMMCRWLPEATEKCNIPSYSHTMVGVGGMVTDSQGRLLVVKERFFNMPTWKLPGGYVERGEDISVAVVREVFEETGVKTRFNSLLAMRQGHLSQFGCSDLYIIALLSPETDGQEITKCDREIAECCWMKVEDFLEHPEAHDLNKMLVRKYLENKEKGVTMPAAQVPHPFFPDELMTVFLLASNPLPSNL